MEYISNGMPSDFVYVVPESIEVGTYHDSPVKPWIRRTNVNKTRISSICVSNGDWHQFISLKL